MPSPKHCRTNSGYRWTTPKIVAFLRALTLTGSVAGAARTVGMSRQSAYRLRARLPADFARMWDDGLALAAVVRGLQGDR